MAIGTAGYVSQLGMRRQRASVNPAVRARIAQRIQMALFTTDKILNGDEDCWLWLEKHLHRKTHQDDSEGFTHVLFGQILHQNGTKVSSKPNANT
jgi:hypothetical protein